MNELEKGWQSFTAHEITALTPILERMGITLDTDQPHISGERFLMSGKKVVLIGTKNDTGETVIIKSSTDPVSKKELQHERTTRDTLHAINFAYTPLLTPKEIWSEHEGERLTIVTQYIAQPIPFLSLPLSKQFDLLLGAFTMLEGVHATTASHGTSVLQFGNKVAADYITLAKTFFNDSHATIASCSESYSKILQTALHQIETNQVSIERYCRFLTHDDFALHNFRFTSDAIYLIDQASLTFGNKHESWARLLNYMVLYNQPLEQAFATYIQTNLSIEEQASIKLMRMYKLIELLAYHALAATESTGDVQTLSFARITFWIEVLKSVSADTKVAVSTIDSYKQTRDSLRTAAEIERQKVLQQLL